MEWSTGEASISTECDDSDENTHTETEPLEQSNDCKDCNEDGIFGYELFDTVKQKSTDLYDIVKG